MQQGLLSSLRYFYAQGFSLPSSPPGFGSLLLSLYPRILTDASRKVWNELLPFETGTLDTTLGRRS